MILREFAAGLALGGISRLSGFADPAVARRLRIYGFHCLLVALTVGVALVGVVTFGSLGGVACCPFILPHPSGVDPAPPAPGPRSWQRSWTSPAW